MNKPVTQGCLLFLSLLLLLQLACGEGRQARPTKPKVGSQVMATGELWAPEPIPNAPHQLEPNWHECVGEPEVIDLFEALSALPLGDVTDQREQVRDWLWAVISEQHRASVDLPAEGVKLQLRPEAWTEHELPPSGRTRAEVIGDDIVLLVDTGDAVSMWEAIARKVDDMQVDHGWLPRNLVLYRSGRVLADGTVRVCRLGPLPASVVMSEKTGLHQATIRTVEDLEAFVALAPDLLSAKCTDVGLEVRGRTRTTTMRKGITAAEIGTFAYEAQRAEEEHGWGFSLDPKYDVAAVAARVRQYAKILDEGGLKAFLAELPERDRSELERLMSQYGQATDAIHEIIFREMLAESVATMDAVGSDTQRMLEAGLENPIVDVAIDQATRQCPRYDGPFAHESISMTLFFTDLLAKISGHRREVGPASMLADTEILLGAEPCERMGAGAGRLWFDFEPSTSRRASGQLRFVSVGTLIYGRNSELGAGYSPEHAANPAFQYGLNRWNSSYADIAEWEPEFERLNQIQKWIAVVRDEDTSACNSRLAIADSRPAYRFSSWVESQSELAWSDVEGIGVSEIDECMPLLRSPTFALCDRDWVITGGVSSATRAKLAKLESPTRYPTPYKAGTSVEAKVIRSDGGQLVVKLDIPETAKSSRAIQPSEDAGALTRAWEHQGRRALKHDDYRADDYVDLLLKKGDSLNDATFQRVADDGLGKFESPLDAHTARERVSYERARQIRENPNADTSRLEQLEARLDAKTIELQQPSMRKGKPRDVADDPGRSPESELGMPDDIFTRDVLDERMRLISTERPTKPDAGLEVPKASSSGSSYRLPSHYLRSHEEDDDGETEGAVP